MTTGRINQVCSVSIRLCKRMLEMRLSTNTRLFELIHEGGVRVMRMRPQEQRVRSHATQPKGYRQVLKQNCMEGSRNQMAREAKIIILLNMIHIS